MASSSVQVKLPAKDIGKLVKEDAVEHWKGVSRHLWISAMFLGTMLLYSARSAVPLCIAAMSRDLSWDKFSDGAVMSAFFWGYTPAQIAGGYLSDCYGGELVLGYAAIIWSLCTFVVPFLPAGQLLFFPPIAVVMLSRVCTGLSQGLHYPSLTNIIVRRIPLKERSFMTSLLFAAGPVGTLLMGSGGSLILDRSNWKSVFLVQVVVGLVWALVWLRYTFLLYRQNDKSGKLIENINKNPFISVPYGKFFKHVGVWAIVICQFAQAGAFWNLFSWLPLYFEEVYPGSKKWVFNVMPWLVIFPSSALSGLLADYMIASGFSVTFVRKLFQTVSMCGSCLCMLLFDWVKTFNQTLILIMISMGLNRLGHSGTSTAPQDMAPKYAGSLFGIVNAAGAFSGIVLVPLTGHVLARSESWQSVFHLNAITLLIGSSIFLVFGTAKKII